jgi:hypothetical protein
MLKFTPEYPATIRVTQGPFAPLCKRMGPAAVRECARYPYAQSRISSGVGFNFDEHPIAHRLGETFSTTIRPAGALDAARRWGFQDLVRRQLAAAHDGERPRIGCLPGDRVSISSTYKLRA